MAHHDHAPADDSNAFTIGVEVNLGYVIVEGGFGFSSCSLAPAGEAQGYLASLPGVVAGHEPHVWAISATETVLTAHLARGIAAAQRADIAQMQQLLAERGQPSVPDLAATDPGMADMPGMATASEEHAGGFTAGLTSALRHSLLYAPLCVALFALGWLLFDLLRAAETVERHCLRRVAYHRCGTHRTNHRAEDNATPDQQARTTGAPYGGESA